MTNILVTVDSATTATTTSYLATYRVDGCVGGMLPPRLPANVGHYEDTFQKVDGLSAPGSPVSDARRTTVGEALAELRLLTDDPRVLQLAAHVLDAGRGGLCSLRASDATEGDEEGD